MNSKNLNLILNLELLILNVLILIDSFITPKLCESILHKAKGSGLLGGLPDLLIIADAVFNKATLYTGDKKMVKLAENLKVEVMSY